MGAKQKMTMRVTIERLRDKKDPYGQPGADWRVYHSEIPCYVWETGDRKITGTSIVEAGSPMMIIGKSIDVTMDDRIQNVIDRRGNELYGIMTIDSIIKRKDHKELRLKKIA